MIAPELIAEILGLGASGRTVGELESAVAAGLRPGLRSTSQQRLYGRLVELSGIEPRIAAQDKSDGLIGLACQKAACER
jgi:hypothetical protein